MKYVTRQDFDAIAAQDKYYKSTERWDLYEAASDIIRDINPESVLELGPYRLPIVPDGHTMDRHTSLKPTYAHDACVFPWPVDREYDVFVALQVWEHLEDNQQQAFREVQRFASHAVLSFPFEWNCPKNPSHHGITRETIADWTLNCEPQSVQIIPSARNYRRILYRFDLT